MHCQLIVLICTKSVEYNSYLQYLSVIIHFYARLLVIEGDNVKNYFSLKKIVLTFTYNFLIQTIDNLRIAHNIVIHIFTLNNYIKTRKINKYIIKENISVKL